MLYVEPGGYYERGLTFDKPVVACVVGRWKSKLTRAVGHAGALAGTGDNAEAKEQWFLDAFGVDAAFTPDNPACSAKGALVRNIADIPAALTAVMRANGVEPDFPPRGDLSLKSWLANDQGLQLPENLRVGVQANLARKYGPGLTVSFNQNTDLIGGLRVQVGSDVYDGSIRARLAELADEF